MKVNDSKSPQTFSIKVEIINILGFVCRSLCHDCITTVTSEWAQILCEHSTDAVVLCPTYRHKWFFLEG
jgi:hypothetical protein